MQTINIVNDYGYEIVDSEIQKYSQFLKNKLDIANKEMTLVLVNEEDIQRFNLEFRQKNKPTDVLTFIENVDEYLGDIIISYPVAEANAKEYNHSLKREICFLITHAFLHLVGYDHQTKEEEKEMFTLQKSLLDEYGIGRAYE